MFNHEVQTQDVALYLFLVPQMIIKGLQTLESFLSQICETVTEKWDKCQTQEKPEALSAKHISSVTSNSEEVCVCHWSFINLQWSETAPTLNIQPCVFYAPAGTLNSICMHDERPTHYLIPWLNYYKPWKYCVISQYVTNGLSCWGTL